MIEQTAAVMTRCCTINKCANSWTVAVMAQRSQLSTGGGRPGIRRRHNDLIAAAATFRRFSTLRVSGVGSAGKDNQCPFVAIKISSGSLGLGAKVAV